MKSALWSVSALAAFCLGSGPLASAQTAPVGTKRPKILQIGREELKPGKGAAHLKNEMGWPAAVVKQATSDPNRWYDSDSGGRTAGIRSLTPIGRGVARVVPGPAREREPPRRPAGPRRQSVPATVNAWQADPWRRA